MILWSGNREPVAKRSGNQYSICPHHPTPVAIPYSLPVVSWPLLSIAVNMIFVGIRKLYVLLKLSSRESSVLNWHCGKFENPPLRVVWERYYPFSVNVVGYNVGLFLLRFNTVIYPRRDIIHSDNYVSYFKQKLCD